NPASQSIVAGAQNLVMGNVQLDASQSGEDLRLSSLPMTLSTTPGSGSDASFLSNCGLWDGTTLVTSGSNVVNTLNTNAAGNVFTFDNPYVVTKSTVKTLSLACNVSSSATSSTFAWNVPLNTSVTGVTGVQSGNTVGNGTGLTTNM